MKGYLSIRETSYRCGVSERRVNQYVSEGGFHIVEFYNSHHPDPNDPDAEMGDPDDQFPDGMLRFEKRMKCYGIK